MFCIADADKPGLDNAEGLHRGYAETVVDVVTKNGTEKALAYVATTTEPGRLPYHWYKELVSRRDPAGTTCRLHREAPRSRIGGRPPAQAPNEARGRSGAEAQRRFVRLVVTVTPRRAVLDRSFCRSRGAPQPLQVLDFWLS